MEMTVAGTAQDFHLIPFYALLNQQLHHQIGCKGTNKWGKDKIFRPVLTQNMKIIWYFVRLLLILQPVRQLGGRCRLMQGNPVRVRNCTCSCNPL